MEAKERNVLYYATVLGTLPFRDWRNSLLSEEIKAVVDARIARFRGGNFGDSKPIGDGALENRIHFGSGYRIYYGLDGDAIVVLLCGGDKSTQRADIKRAVDYWNDYKDREKERKRKHKPAKKKQ